MRRRSHRPRRSRWPSILGTALTAATVSGCGGPSVPPAPSPPPVTEDGRYCPPPLVFEDPADRPRFVRVENRTDDTLTVFLDWCFRRTRVAEVPPGRFRQERIPDRVRPVAFPEGFRFHAVDLGAQRSVGTFTVPVDDDGILDLVLSDETRAVDSLLVQYHFDERQGDMVGRFALMEGDGWAYAATWAEPGLGILTWTCSDSGPSLSLGAPVELGAGRTRVRIRTDGGPWREMGEWEVVQGSGPANDVVVERGGGMWRLTRAAMDAGRLDVVLEPAGGRPQLHRFRVNALREALATLECFGDVPGPGAD